MINPWQRPLPDITQHLQQTNIHALGGIRTHILSRRAAKNLRLRPRGHWDRHEIGPCCRDSEHDILSDKNLRPQGSGKRTSVYKASKYNSYESVHRLSMA